MRPRLCAAPAALALLSACAGAPSYMAPEGEPGHTLARLGWALTAIAAAVVVIVTGLVLAGALRGGGEAGLPVERTGEHRGIRWIVVGGIVVPAIILTGTVVATSAALAAASSARVHPALTIEVTGHRWWWEARYLSDDPSLQAATANEIHIPVGRPVRIRLASADVIHSFWIPQLAGKMDLIPGLHNEMWLRADHPGVYRGQCAEYCGLQHAEMAVYVVADPPARFQAWLARQREPARPTAAAAAGQAVFARSSCMACHTIRGTNAMGVVGPDLTHVGSRRTLAAGVIPNTPGYMAGWIADPQGVKPGNVMPATPLPAAELQALVAYLQSLK
jgi:cytochrome c oxidase subunit 2